MNNKNYNLGLVSISFRKNSPRKILEIVREAGLSCIEWGSDVHAPCNDSEKLREIAAMQKEYSITCSSYGTYFRLGETPIDELERYITAAKILGTDILRLWCGTKSGSNMTREETDSLLAECRKAAKIASEQKVTLCMECHKNTFTENLSDALLLMNEINSPRFRMYWQPFQWKSCEENLAYAKAIAPFTHHIHVFQWKDKARFPLKEGLEEWKGYLALFSAPRTLLLEFMPDDRTESLPVEADSLKRIVGEKK
ncbi:MAG: sugar phosphate isomerase/epimerase [Clostridia bacterium]|nr:sugar phosphate isomerase/epimerase [Clostridia bacterium]